MYSILIKTATSSQVKWKYLTNQDGTVYVEDDLANVQTKIAELLNSYVLGDIKVVKNCIITNTITVEEVEPEI